MARHGDLIEVKHRAPMAALSPRTSIICSPPPDGAEPVRTGTRADVLALDAHGVPLFNRRTLQCGRSPIFIAGDVNNELPLLHEAADEGRIAGENAAHYPDVRPGLRRAGIAIVFTDPGIAIVGGGWREAQSVPHVAGEVSFHNQGRRASCCATRPAARLCRDRRRRFLGAEMLGPDAEHIGHLLAWALQMKLTVQQMLDMPFYHPVIEEGVRTALRDARSKLAVAQAARRAA